MFKISKGHEYVQKTIRLPDVIVDRLEKLASDNNISFNKIIIQCIEYALENLCEKNDRF